LAEQEMTLNTIDEKFYMGLELRGASAIALSGAHQRTKTQLSERETLTLLQ